MVSINFEVDPEIKAIIDEISKIKGISAAELAKRALLKEISCFRVELAFNLLKEGKIGRKKAWKLSGLTAFEFMREWTARGAEERLPLETIEKEIELAEILDLDNFKK